MSATEGEDRLPNLTELRQFRERIEELKNHLGEKVDIDDIQTVVQAIMASLNGDMTAKDLRVYSELEGLSKYIYNAKQEISQISPEDIAQEHIPIASDELDAIGTHLEDATGNILDACEIIENYAEETKGEKGEQLLDAVTRIYEACNFQDLTGQRISKIVTMLQNIEKRVELILKAFGHDIEAINKAKRKPPSDNRAGDERLLNGPQIPVMANSQAEIDALFASFD